MDRRPLKGEMVATASAVKSSNTYKQLKTEEFHATAYCVTGLTAATTYYLRVTWSDPDTVSGISPQLLEWKGIEATEKLALSPNSKIVVIGNPKSGLPIILGGGER